MRQTSSPQTVGRYEIHGKIASGGMATVHFGRLLGGAGFARTVAIKRLHPHLAEDPAFCASIIDEARLAERIHHPNVVQMLDVVAHGKELLLVMEYVRGESLAQAMQVVVARNQRVPIPIVSAIAIGALSGLHAAHEATSDLGTPLGLVHRDVSPQNILVGTDGLARLIDFGVAKGAGRLQTTQEGMVKGKFAYMAPEQLAARTVARTADIYAMGVVLWEMLTCRRLIDGEDEAALMGSLLAGPKEPPSAHTPGLPAALDALVMKALAIEAADRFATAREMAEALASVIPPAQLAEVGAWCVEVAHEALAKRATAVAEIESPSSGTMNEEGRDKRGKRDETRAAAELGHDDEVAPTIASQPASVALGTARRLAHPPARRTVVAGALGAILVLGLVSFAQWGRSRGAPGAAESRSTAAGGIPSVPEVELSERRDASAVGAVPAVAVPAVSAPVPSEGVAPASAATLHTGQPRSVTPSAPPSPSKATSTCTPPYVFDAHGNKKGKRQCL